MSPKIAQNPTTIQAFLSDLQVELAQMLAQTIEAQLEAKVTAWLYRAPHERRAGLKRRSQACCQRCGSQEAAQFRRNGHRKRHLVTQFGVIRIWLPRVVCECGGSVQMPFSILAPYQQLWADVVSQVSRWADLGLSLRQMQAQLAAQCHTQVGLRTLNQLVHALRPPTAIELSSVPAVVQLDAIWVPLLQDSDERQPDRLQRQRVVKTRRKVCVLVALGVYPQSGRWGILGWHVADSESQAAWEALLDPLAQRGLYRQRGLQLLIHDGGKGLIAALRFLYPHVPHQRCSFHKLRNLWHSLRTPPDLTRTAARAFKREVLHQARAIFEAADETEADQLQHALVERWADTQPEFVATLQRDWHDTVAFLRVLRRFPNWPRSALRTTSLLERVNRMLRRLFRPKGAFHSLNGLQACVAPVLTRKRLL